MAVFYLQRRLADDAPWTTIAAGAWPLNPDSLGSQAAGEGGPPDRRDPNRPAFAGLPGSSARVLVDTQEYEFYDWEETAHFCRWVLRARNHAAAPLDLPFLYGAV